ncbi:MAG: YcfL family protein [Burkholderiales bacterium]
MIRIVLALLIVALAGLAGCRSKGFEHPGSVMGCPTGGDKKIKDTQDLIAAKADPSGNIADIEIVEMRCAERGERLRIEIDLKNDSKDVRRLAWRFRWLDKEGMRAWEEETWKPELLYGNTRHTVSTVSPSREAVDFRFMLMDQDK